MSDVKKFTVFLAGVIQGSLEAAAIHPQDWREPIADLLERHCPGAEVYCHFSRHRNSIAYDDAMMVATFEQGNRAAAASDLVICWLPQASMGTAVEMYLAWKAGAAVVAVSPMAANWVIRTCSDRIVADLAGLEALLSDPAAMSALIAAARQRRSDADAARRLDRLDAFWQDGAP